MLLISIFHLDSKTSNLPRPGDSWFNSCVLTCQFVWTGSSSFSQHEKTTFRMVENPPRSNPHGFSPEFQSITSFNKHPLLPPHFSSFLHIFHHFPRLSQRFPQICRSRPWLRWPWPSHEASWLRPPPGGLNGTITKMEVYKVYSWENPWKIPKKNMEALLRFFWQQKLMQ